MFRVAYPVSRVNENLFQDEARKTHSPSGGRHAAADLPAAERPSVRARSIRNPPTRRSAAMKVSECMTRDVQTVTSDQPIREAAMFMLRADAGSMPVCDGNRVVGMITDRDIAVRAVAAGHGPDTPVREAMTDHADCCFDDEEVEEVAMKMSDAQVRRFPVLSRADGKLVGIVSLGDLSRSELGEAASIALAGITDPGGAHDQTTEAR
jgi:CBS domain-containing protein